MRALASLFCGFVFGWGLFISGMMRPDKVLGFLDIFAIPNGKWDPSLAVVMAAALAVTGVGYALLRRRTPIFETQSHWPTQTAIDRPLVTGSILFGVGWGLVGTMPGTGDRQPGDVVFAGHRFCCCHGGRHAGARSVVCAQCNAGHAFSGAGERRRRLDRTRRKEKPASAVAKALGDRFDARALAAAFADALRRAFVVPRACRLVQFVTMAVVAVRRRNNNGYRTFVARRSTPPTPVRAARRASFAVSQRSSARRMPRQTPQQAPRARLRFFATTEVVVKKAFAAQWIASFGPQPKINRTRASLFPYEVGPPGKAGWLSRCSLPCARRLDDPSSLATV